jgi:hypothetical protein
MNWKSINSEQSYYTISKTSHIQQRIIGKKWKALAKVLSIYPSSTVQPTQHTLYLLGHVVALASIMLQHNPNICLHCSTWKANQCSLKWCIVVYILQWHNPNSITRDMSLSKEILNLLVEWDGERWVYAFNSSMIANQSFILLHNNNNTNFLIYFYNN